MSANKPAVLLITRNLPPLLGGMERLNWHLADELRRDFDVWLVAPAGSSAQAPHGITQTREASLKPLWRFLLQGLWHAISMAREARPRFVLAGSGLTAPLALIAARLAGARAAAYVHGLDVAVHHPVYRWLWHPASRKLDVVIANSIPTRDLALAIGVSADKIHVVHPGVSLPGSPRTYDEIHAFKARHGLLGHRILLSAGRLTTRKGLREFVQECLPLIVRDAPDTLLAIAGDAPTNALHAQAQTPASIQAAAEAAGVGHHIRFLGVITDPVQLACAYEAATIHVFPVRSLPGDPEGFGMVAIEAAAHGTPTVAYATGGVVDAVRDGASGQLVAAGHALQFAEAVQRLLEQPLPEQGMRKFAARFEWARFGERIRAILDTAPE